MKRVHFEQPPYNSSYNIKNDKYTSKLNEGVGNTLKFGNCISTQPFVNPHYEIAQNGSMFPSSSLLTTNRPNNLEINKEELDLTEIERKANYPKGGSYVSPCPTSDIIGPAHKQLIEREKKHSQLPLQQKAGGGNNQTPQVENAPFTTPILPQLIPNLFDANQIDYTVTSNGSYLLQNLRTLNTTRVEKSHMKYLLLLREGTEEEFQKLLLQLIAKGLKKSYVIGIFNTIRKHFRAILPNWIDPMAKITNRNMISRAYKNLEKMNSNRDYYIDDETHGLKKIEPHDANRANLINYVGSMKPNTLIIGEKNMQKLLDFVRANIKEYENLGNTGSTDLFRYSATYQFYILFILLYTSGARFGEIFNMSLENANLFVTDKHVSLMGKNGRQELFIPDVVALSLANYILFMKNWKETNSNRLFTITDNKMRTRFREMYEFVLGEKKPDWVGFHSLRRNYSFVVSRNDLSVASIAMNHTNIKTTMRYIDSNKQDCDRIRKPINKTFNEIFEQG